MRGKGLYRFGGRPLPGITPAYAGKSHFQQRLFRPCRDHPRMCGEKHCTSTPIALVSGSPPRVRGKETWTRPMPIYSRITPACAGKRAYLLRMLMTSQDHPRVCGEKFCGKLYSSSPSGSPPRMRGKVDLQVIACIFLGITPAYAGKSPFPECGRWRPGDHPRMCGEKQAQMDCIQLSLGSPPRMRGKVPSSI